MMNESGVEPSLPKGLRAYIALVGISGMAWLAYLVPGAEWDAAALGEMALFVLLIVAAGSFPLPVAPRVKADVTTAVLFAAALLLEPGVAVLAGVTGIVIYTVSNRFWGQRLRLPWYKYPFNAGQTALYVGVASVIFQALSPGDVVLTGAVVPAAVCIYMLNTALVSCAVTLQMGMNPVRIWWMGTRGNGPAEFALLAFGFLGAVVYRESPWTIVALFIPVAIIYMAFSRLAGANARLEEALGKLEALQGRIVSTSKLASVGAISLDLAHQIKNPLAIVLGRLEGVQDRLEVGTRERHHVDIALDAGWRIQELTKTFSSIGQQKWVEQDVRELLDEALGMAGLRNHKRIDTIRAYGEDLAYIRGNPVLIREAFSNIFSNAMEAVTDGEAVITVDASRVNGTVIVRVSDNGEGISDDRIPRLFEPFNTTKPNGQGLGLFAAKHILEMHEGSVEIASEQGEGTCVTMSLPVAPSEDDGPEESNDNLLSLGSG